MDSGEPSAGGSQPPPPKTLPSCLKKVSRLPPTGPVPSSISTKEKPAIASTAAKKVEAVPSKQPSSHSIIVSPRQKGNPLLSLLKNVSWEYGSTVADFELSRTNCALYLSLRYHNLHPKYVIERADGLGRSYDLRVLLVSVDTDESGAAISELAHMCILADLTLMLTFTLEEAARYLETYKAYEHKPADSLMDSSVGGAKSHEDMAVAFLTSVKGISRRDAIGLLGSFGSVAQVMDASVEDLCLCTGFGLRKATRLHDTMREAFLRTS